MDIFEKLSLIILPILITAFFASIIPRKLKERQRFNESATAFRDAFRHEIAFLGYNTGIKGAQSTDGSISQFLRTGMVHRHTEALIAFKKNLSSLQRRSIDKAWQKYQKQIDNYKAIPMFEKEKEEALEIIEAFLDEHAKLK